MAVFKCKMCGGEIVIENEAQIATCEYCGSKQTIPSVDDEKKLRLFERANKLRLQCEFDKAYGVYESIVEEAPEEAEAYWGLVLCTYGIEYVKDPKTEKYIPTCHRSSFDSVMDDENLELALENANVVAKALYREQAIEIEEIRKGIVELSSKAEKYDIFICYKETDVNGERTIDSVLAQDVYTALTKEGYRVFFSRITLEDKLGVEYEPYIFSALHSSKVMLAFGTSYDNFHAVWVKNEWSRYLKLMEAGEEKTLIPCFKNISAYDMPKEFARLQAQDLGKVGAIQDLVRGIGKIISAGKKTEEAQAKPQATQVVDGLFAPILKKASAQLARGEFKDAKESYEKVLDFVPSHDEASLGILLAEMKCKTRKELEESTDFFHELKAYQNIEDMCSEEIKNELALVLEKIRENNYKAIEKCFKEENYKGVSNYVFNLLEYEEKDERTALYLFLAQNEVRTIEELVSKETPICDLPGYSAFILYATDETKKALEILADKQKTYAYNKLEKEFSAGKYGRIEALAKIALSFERKERPYLLTFLAMHQVKSIDDLIPKETEIFNLKGYKELINNVGEETKKAIENAIAKQKENAYNELETAFYAGEYAKIEALSEKALRFGNEEKPYLLAFLAYYKVDSIDVLDSINSNFLKEEPYELLKENGTSETLDKLSYMATRQRERIAFEVKEAFEEKNFNVALEKCKLYKEFDLKNEEINLIHLFAELGISTFDEIEALGVVFTENETYKTLIASCSDETKAMLDKALSGQNAHFEGIRQQKIVALESEIQEALEKSDFEKAKSLANECLELDSKNEKAHLAIYLASKRVRVIEDLAEQRLDFTVEKNYKELLPFLSNETKKRFENAIAKIEAEKKKKKILITSAMVVVALALIVAIIMGIGSYMSTDAYIFGASDASYGGVIISDYRGDGGDVVIPNEIDGKPVVAIGEKAFYDLDKLKSVVIPEGVTTIGKQAFYNCGGLTKIEMPNSVTTIEDSAFSWCERLTSIEIPNSVTSIGEYAFSYCSSLTSIEIPDSVKTIGRFAFSNCSSLTSILIPDSVTTIETFAFAWCKSLQRVVIPNGVTTIEPCAFSFCDRLIIYCEAQRKPSGWDSNWSGTDRMVIWGYTRVSGATEDGFEWIESYKSIDIQISGYTGNSENIEIPSEINGKPVTSIGEEAFSHCFSLTSVVIPNSVTTIGEYAFYNCESLTSVVMPNSVTTIGSSAFARCDSLESIVIPNSVTTIGDDAFYECDGLESIVIPNSVTAIGEYAFSSCDNLTIYCQAEEKPSGWHSYWGEWGKLVVWGYTGK